MLILSRSECQAAITMSEAIDAAAAALAAYSSGQAQVPLRIHLQCPDGIALYMPGFVRAPNADTGSGVLGAKVVSVFGSNPARGLPTITAAMVLQDLNTGEPLAILEAGYLTALRTGAASGVATRYLARADARRVLMLGAGVQARTQLAAVRAVRPITEVMIYDPNTAAACGLAGEVTALGLDCRAIATPDEAVAWADVIIAATTATRPVFSGNLVRPGVHVNGVGAYTPEMQELPEELILKADRVVSDTREGALAEAGDLMIPLARGVIGPDRVDSEVGDLVLGRAPGRRSEGEITVYKGVGLAALDLVTAQAIYASAVTQGFGTKVDLLS